MGPCLVSEKTWTSLLSASPITGNEFLSQLPSQKGDEKPFPPSLRDPSLYLTHLPLPSFSLSLPFPNYDYPPFPSSPHSQPSAPSPSLLFRLLLSNTPPPPPSPLLWPIPSTLSFFPPQVEPVSLPLVVPAISPPSTSKLQFSRTHPPAPLVERPAAGQRRPAHRSSPASHGQRPLRPAAPCRAASDTLARVDDRC